MRTYLKLNPDQMAVHLNDFQKLSRAMMDAARDVPFSMDTHHRAVDALFQKAKWLADQGDVQ